MDSLKMVVDLACSGVIPFITVAMVLLSSCSVIYFIYRGIRDFEVYLLERKRIDSEQFDFSEFEKENDDA